jgi:hypothetical protein
VLFLVCSLIEDGFAALNWAFEGLFPGMDAEMVEQVVPFREKLITPFVLAEEGSCKPCG